MRTTLLATMLSFASAVFVAHANPRGGANSRTKRNTQTTLVRCIDGKLAPSIGRGTCSEHGGVLGPGKIPLGPKASPPRHDTTTTARISGARCADGTTAKTTGRRACARHGGLAPQTTSRLGEAVARCRDGWVAYSAHRGGSCTTHGGVREWL